jgi:hypothetical protein
MGEDESVRKSGVKKSLIDRSIIVNIISRVSHDSIFNLDDGLIEFLRRKK